MWQRPIIQYIEEPSISALRVKAEKEEEMKNLDDYWKERLQKQEVTESSNLLSGSQYFLFQETFIANAKLTEEEILRNAKYVQTLFKPAATGQFCRLELIFSRRQHVSDCNIFQGEPVSSRELLRVPSQPSSQLPGQSPRVLRLRGRRQVLTLGHQSIVSFSDIL